MTSTASVHASQVVRNPKLAERKGCAECGTTEHALMAPEPNMRNYSGPLYCLSCNPRFGGGLLDAQWSCLERMEA